MQQKWKILPTYRWDGISTVGSILDFLEWMEAIGTQPHPKGVVQLGAQLRQRRQHTVVETLESMEAAIDTGA